MEWHLKQLPHVPDNISHESLPLFHVPTFPKRIRFFKFFTRVIMLFMELAPIPKSMGRYTLTSSHSLLNPLNLIILGRLFSLIMKTIHFYFILISIVLALSCSAPEAPPLISYVNPFIGTGGHGHTFPGATVPFGMVQLSPDTRPEGWDGCGGYHYSDSIVYGFSHTHLSGTGVPDYADVLLMPAVGPLWFSSGYKGDIDQGYGSRFSHAREKASPGYYEVLLDDYQIHVALTATTRAGFHKYTFPENNEAYILLDLEYRDELLSHSLEILNDSTLRGKRVSKAWAEEQHVYFFARFSKPFLRHSLHPGDSIPTKAAFHFSTQKGEEILVKVGISAVSEEGAEANLLAEIPHWDFNKARQQAEALWEEELRAIEVTSANKEEKTVFYTALYHTLLQPNVFTDVDGRYRGMDRRIHQATDHTQYTVFSLWDTFRGAHPLYTLIQQARTRDFIHTFLAHYQQGGMLPVWELAGNETMCMIGYHSVPVIYDAWAKGLRDFDEELALKAMRHSAELDHLGLKAYRTHGYIPAHEEPESVSKTLEYAYDDWCIAQMAKDLGKTDLATTYFQRAQHYKNVFDPHTGFMRARMNGMWFSPFDPAEVNYNFTEANSWQYSMFVPHDISGMIQLYGGPEAFEKKLDELFETEAPLSGTHQVDITGLIGQYAHGNEPSHHMAYLYNFIGKPWKTQQRVNQILQEMYWNGPDGLSGNEDCGQMSAWYILSAMGFYSVTPGLPYYTLGTPLFEEVSLRLENGNRFTVKAKGRTPANAYIQSATLNGKPYKKAYLRHADIMAGGVMEFVMGSQPNEDWFDSFPVSALTETSLVPTPFVLAEGRTFTDSLWVDLGVAEHGLSLYYTLDGTPPTHNSEPYKGPILLRDHAVLQAVAYRRREASYPTRAEFFRIKGNRSIRLESTYASHYAAGGDNALIDHLRGGANYRTGSWQGYQGQDVVAVVDLGETTQVKEVAMGFLQDIKSWVWFPRQVKLSVSTDGKTFRPLETRVNTFSDREYGSFIQDFTWKPNMAARFLRLEAQYYGPCPDWHLGAGGSSWLFADEIVVK
jgi:predicted alpha-1,2-mannosidase